MHNIDRLPLTTSLLKTDVPEMLHHYTSSAALISVIDSRQFWAGRPEQMNDGMELSYAFKWLGIVGGDAELDEDRPQHERLFGKWIYRRTNDGTAQRGPSAFLISLSEEGDSLSQWRAYCDRSGGVCLGVPGRSVLAPAADAQQWVLAPCVYAEDAQEKMVRELFDLHLSDLWNHLDSNGLNAPGREKEHTRAIIDHCDRVFADLRKYGLFIKHPSFHAEKEWRLVKFCEDEPTLQELRFAPGTDGVRVFYPFQILEPTHPEFPTHPRPTVRIGPTRVPGTAEYATGRLLEKWVGAGNADVFKTSSSFR
ncbi:DUF2971 domain-containing protein [Prescottella equi]|uniref:DUF2971 domain-containing protein n=1 Tax=Rhodococcus hoagii TaxID=43767 RepID=UPI003B788E23